MTAPSANSGSTFTALLRAASQWVIGVALAVMLLFLFLAINAAQISSEGAGQRILRWSVAVGTNIDAILPDLQAALQEEAREGGADPVRVPDFPILVEIPRDDALSLEGAALRVRVLNEAGARLYEDGMSAWAGADLDSEQSIETISAAGALKRGLGLITDKNHDRIVIAAIVLGVLSAVFAVMLVASMRSWGRLVALSAVTIAAALPSLAAAVAVRFGFRTAQEGADPFVSGLLDLGVEAMWVPIRNYLALTVLGFTVMLLTLVIIWVSSRQVATSVDTPPA
ncbi:MAG: hypothetical protein IH864_03640 [Chloroflexi bacterium]|nr:hypothetical protein [Chloroflexota bacterium]